ncbi:hypothetical protein [Paenibacillus tianmuensis]|uniref:hypothetical protein n=1 Tax=Paenibacillus tianmuensis TaxID=624147 RepID=UPI000B8310E4|nr:hypothetical protein [Paenibacillus tianmuensis]
MIGPIGARTSSEPHTMRLARLPASFRGGHVLRDKESMANAGAFDTMERKYSQARHKRRKGCTLAVIPYHYSVFKEEFL